MPKQSESPENKTFRVEGRLPIAIFLAQIVFPVAIGAALAYTGFYLTGILAAHIDPRAIGFTAGAVFLSIAFAAWGLPAGIAWLAIGYAARERQFRMALVGASTETVALLAGGLLYSSVNTGLAELRALAVVLLWPEAFLALASVFGVLLGTKLRQIPGRKASLRA